MSKSALFIAFEDLLDRNNELLPGALRLLADFFAHNYPIIALCGSDMEKHVLENAEQLIRTTCGMSFTKIIFLKKSYHFRSILKCASRFQLSLERSLFLTDGAHIRVAISAGIGQVKSCALVLYKEYSAA